MLQQVRFGESRSKSDTVPHSLELCLWDDFLGFTSPKTISSPGPGKWVPLVPRFTTRFPFQALLMRPDPVIKVLARRIESPLWRALAVFVKDDADVLAVEDFVVVGEMGAVVEIASSRGCLWRQGRMVRRFRPILAEQMAEALVLLRLDVFDGW